MTDNIAYVGIDASITSTAVCISIDGRERFYNYTTKEKLDKWKKEFEPVVTYRHVLYDHPKDYSADEVYKVTEYNRTADLVAQDIRSIVGDCKVVCAIEGYSYSSQAGHLIDLVTFGSALRKRMIDMDAELNVLSPTQLKSEACRIAYNNIDKKVWRDPNGLAGGSFKKPDMMKACIVHDPSCGLGSVLRTFEGELLKMKNLPKPVDDVVDAWWCVRHLISR